MRFPKLCIMKIDKIEIQITNYKNVNQIIDEQLMYIQEAL